MLKAPHFLKKKRSSSEPERQIVSESGRDSVTEGASMHAIQYLPTFHIKPFVFFFSVTFHIFHISPFQQRPETMLLLPHDLGLVLILRVPQRERISFHFIGCVLEI